MRGPGRWWRGKSTPAKFETYTRWSFHFFGVSEILAIALLAFSSLGPGLGGALLTMVTVHAVLCMLTVSRGLDWSRGRRPQPVRLLWTLGSLTAAIGVAALWIAQRGPDREDVDTTAGAVFGFVLTVGTGILPLGVRDRRRVYAIVAGFSLGAGVACLPLNVPLPAAVLSMVGIFLTSGLVAVTALFSVWLLDAVYQLDEARETRARLAVAEERLRFGRDLHDVMGRNLAVIALKAELAVQLARRGRPEAVEQMIEVQRIAQDSQREVREVVRGYREADLSVELTGAQSVLSAAGIDCETRGEADGLPGEVQSALGWVVRETTTNVLRHGDARRCAVELRITEGRVVLTVENDGAEAVRDGAGGGGSGLAGLRERLRQVDGTLEAGFVRPGVFRVVAEVPLERTTMVSEVTS